MIKLMAIDVDGTLLHDDHHLSERNKKAIFMAKEKGIKVILATGRGPRSCDPLIDSLKLTDLMITHNGAVLYDPTENRAEEEVGYKPVELMPVVEYCRARNIHFDASTAFDIYTEELKEEYIPIYQQFFAQPIVVDDIACLKETIVKFTLTIEPGEIERIYADMLPRFSSFSIIRSGEMFIDVMHPQATKGHGLRSIMDRYKLTPDQVMAFGNYYNDLGMLKIAGIGVAMKNAPLDVQAKADWIAKTNNEDGVAQVIEELLTDVSG